MPIGKPTLLPLPWLNYTAALPTKLSDITPSALHQIYATLLAASREHIASHAGRLAPEDEHAKRSHNLFVTSRHMHLVPRRDRMVRVPRKASASIPASSTLAAANGGAEDEFRLSVNGLLVLGYWYVSNDKEREDLISLGLEKALIGCGYPNEVSVGATFRVNMYADAFGACWKNYVA